MKTSSAGLVIVLPSGPMSISETVISTGSGDAPGLETLKEVLAFTDCVLYDIKHMDQGIHRQLTGKPNDLILTNAKVVAESGVSMLCRVPLIAGVNDTAHNITETARFLKTLKDGIAVELLPYHRLGIEKYSILDKPYLGKDLAAPEAEHVESIKRTFEELGVSCTVGG